MRAIDNGDPGTSDMFGLTTHRSQRYGNFKLVIYTRNAEGREYSGSAKSWELGTRN